MSKHSFNYPKEFTPGQITFSIGIFEWVDSKKKGKLKKSKAKVRVRASITDKTKALELAASICRDLNNDVYTGPKNVTIK